MPEISGLMSHHIYRVTAFKIVGPYTLEVSFDDGIQLTIDFRPVLKGKLYGPLMDRDVFERVRIDPEVHTLVWPNGADFDPATLHDWRALLTPGRRNRILQDEARASNPPYSFAGRAQGCLRVAFAFICLRPTFTSTASTSTTAA